MKDLEILVGKDSLIKLKKKFYLIKAVSTEIVFFSDYISWNETDENIYLLIRKIFVANKIDLNLIDDLDTPQINVILDLVFSKIEKQKEVKKESKKKKKKETHALLSLALFLKFYVGTKYDDVMQMPYNVYVELTKKIPDINKLQSWKTLKEIEDWKKTTPDLKKFKKLVE